MTGPSDEATRLPAGVAVRALPGSDDGAQRVTEVYRDDPQGDFAPAQWNFVRSAPETLRGVHVHLHHWDYLHVLSGAMLLGLHDLRPASPTYRMAAHCRLSGDRPAGIAIPPGVAHGFYFAASTTYFYALSSYWSTADEFGCRWNDPELGLSWPTGDPLLSPRDAAASSYQDLVNAVTPALARDGGLP
jgi:dTDP-4-dehydrorhamnose 3,5-epimerase